MSGPPIFPGVPGKFSRSGKANARVPRAFGGVPNTFRAVSLPYRYAQKPCWVVREADPGVWQPCFPAQRWFTRATISFLGAQIWFLDARISSLGAGHRWPDLSTRTPKLISRKERKATQREASAGNRRKGGIVPSPKRTAPTPEPVPAASSRRPRAVPMRERPPSSPPATRRLEAAGTGSGAAIAGVGRPLFLSPRRGSSVVRAGEPAPLRCPSG